MFISQICKISPIAMGLSVSVCVYVSVCLSVKTSHLSHLVKIKNVKNDVCRYWHLPSNGVIEKIALRDLDLLLGSKDLNFLYVWNDKSKRKNMWQAFVDFDISDRMVYLRKLNSVTLTYFLEVKN